MYIHLPGLAEPAPAPKTIWLNNTDLNAPYFGGNFNFLYNGGDDEAAITFNTYLSYRKNYTNALKRDFVDRLRNAVAVWDSAAEVQVRDGGGNYNKRIKLVLWELAWFPLYLVVFEIRMNHGTFSSPTTQH